MQVLVGGRRVVTSVVMTSGDHVLTVPSPSEPMSAAHLLLHCHTTHAKLLQDSLAVTYVPRETDKSPSGPKPP